MALNLIPSINKSVVGVNITPRSVTFSWIKPTTDGPAPYDVKAFKQLLFETRPKASLRIFNQTRLQILISTFLETNKLSNACVIFALSGEGMIEKQVMLSKPAADLDTIEKAEFREPGFADTASNHMQWHYYCLQDTKKHHEAPWYCCGISRALLFQYQLLAIRCKLNLIQVTTPTMALLQAHRYLKKLRDTNPNTTEKVTIMSNLNVKKRARVTTERAHGSLAEGFGLFLLGREQYATH